MQFHEEPTTCQDCGRTFKVEYASTPELARKAQLEIPCPHCAAMVVAVLSRPAMVYVARPTDSAPVLPIFSGAKQAVGLA
jgi:hypothetical protein